jgi:hypothetical protein
MVSMSTAIYDLNHPIFQVHLQHRLWDIEEDYQEGQIDFRLAGKLWELYTNPKEETLVTEWLECLEEVMMNEKGDTAGPVYGRSLAEAKAQGYRVNHFGRWTREPGFGFRGQARR